MGKKTAAVLMLVPVVVSILGFTTYTIVKNTMQVDYTDAILPYKENEGFKVSNQGYKLEATPVYDTNFTLAPGNGLYWYVSSESDDDVCDIQQQDDGYYLYGNKEGSATITCASLRGTMTPKSFNAIFYGEGAIIINTALPSAYSSVTGQRKFGQYDVYNGNKLMAEIPLDITVYSDADSDYAATVDGNAVFEDDSLMILGSGEISLTLTLNNMPSISQTYTIEVVPDGVNVYNYDDLLFCTNQSEEGEVVVMQTNLGSMSQVYEKDEDGHYIDEKISDDTQLFGHYDFRDRSFSFDEEVYKFVTTYDHEYIDQYFEQVPDTKENRKLKDVELNVVAGIRVQKDFYGNGFYINMDNLCYPHHGTYNTYSGKLTPGEEDLFKGPKTFLSLGDISAPAIKAFGQDNCGMYVDADDVTIDDLRIQNADTNDNFYNYEYTGTVIDVHGDGVTIQNSVLTNGRTCLRVYADDFLLDNCALMNAREFLMKVGSDDYVKTDPDTQLDLSWEGYDYSGRLEDFCQAGDSLMDLDSLLTAPTGLVTDLPFPMDQKFWDDTLKAVNTIQEAMDNTTGLVDENGNPIFHEHITVNDTYFYQSGIFSIGMDTLFNGPYLYSGLPSFVPQILSYVMDNPIVPHDISGTMAPVQLKLTGATRFYDFKDIDTVDASCLIEERLGEILQIMGDTNKIEINQYFPMINLLKEYAKENSLSYTVDDKTYINSVVAFYGGGLNLSQVDFSGLDDDYYTAPFDIDVAKACLTKSGLSPSENHLVDNLAQCVPMASGFNPFQFCLNNAYADVPPLFGETPNLADLAERAR